MRVKLPGRFGGERGQALVIMVLGLVAVLAMVGLIVDGGFTWAQQRNTQNGSDAASEAGATVLGLRLANPNGSTSGNWDTDVANAVSASATANRIQVPFAYYTDICGVLLTPGGGAAIGLADAAQVGAGALPAGSGPPPDPCPSATGAVGPVAGVKALGSHTSGTFFARIVGINEFKTDTDATAVAGYANQSCSGTADGNCILMPIASFYNITACGQNGRAVDTGVPYSQVMNQPIVLPICKAGDGNVGWLDWSTGNGGVGGTDGLVDCVARSATSNPCIPVITPPVWFPIAQSGGTSSGPLEDALNVYAGQIVLLPIYNLMCSSNPDPAQAATPPNYGCPPPNVCTIATQDNTTGCHPGWYHLQPFAAFRLSAVHTNGNPVDECNPAWSNPDPNDTSNKKTKNCIIGEFVDYSIPNGEVGSSPSGSGGSVIGVQLIK